MSTYLKEDFLIFSKYYPNHLRFIYCPFSTLEQYIAGIKVNLVESPINILVGNSNSPESNHLDVFHKINHTRLPEKTKIFTPLSYGDDDDYKEKILSHGKYLLDTKFVPLIDFMERSEYISMLTSYKRKGNFRIEVDIVLYTDSCIGCNFKDKYSCQIFRKI